jgi:hypothetical protein
MGFLQRFLRTTDCEVTGEAISNRFQDLSEDQLEAHLGIARYGNFWLTDAIRPSYDLQVVPTAGYRHDHYIDRETKVRIPVLMAAASQEVLLDLFFELLEPLGDTVDVVLESSHARQSGHEDLVREHMDAPILKSTLYDFEDLLLNDGCTGLAVLNPQLPLEVQFDEHKLLIMYGMDLKPFEEVLERFGLTCQPDLKFITEAEHVHSSTEEYSRQLEQLKLSLGIDAEPCWD